MTHEEFARQVGEMLRGLAADIECGRVVAQAREEGPYKAALGTPRTAHKYFTLVYSVAGGESPAGRAAAGGLQNTPPLSGGEMHAGIVELVEEELSSTVKTVSQISELLKLQGVADT